MSKLLEGNSGTYRLARWIMNSNSSPKGWDWLTSPEKARRDRKIAARLLPIASVPIGIGAGLIRLSGQEPFYNGGYKEGGPRKTKLQTMIDGADNLETVVTGGEAMAKLKGRPDFKDKRITLIGRWLRWTSIDELPQLGDAARSEVLLVGPRMLAWSDVLEIRQRSDTASREFTEYFARGGRHGVICLPEVCGRDRLDLEERTILNNMYLTDATCQADNKILLLVLFAVVNYRGK